MRKELIEEIKAFTPYNEQEEKDKEEILFLLETTDNIFLRENRQYHMTASAWVINKGHTKVLMAYHNVYQSWSWLGGHADGEEDLKEVALREVNEESGVHAKLVDDSIFSLEILTVDGHIKRGEYVPSHLHLNITYLFEADEKESLAIKKDENSGVSWFEEGKVLEAVSEEWMKKYIYQKLINKKKECF